MEHLQFGGRPTPGFGVGALPQGTFAKPASQGGDSLFALPTGKVGAFLGGAAMSAVAAAAATTFFGEGASVGGVKSVAARLQRNWKMLAATAVAGGIVGAVAK
jgi:hypothetical protein